MKQLENKIAIITGAGSGIGKSAALLFSKEGAKVVVSDISEANGNSVVEEIKKSGGEAFFIKADSSKAADNEALVKQTIEKYGSLDIAVNNAGIGGPFAATGEYPIRWMAKSN